MALQKHIIGKYRVIEAYFGFCSLTCLSMERGDKGFFFLFSHDLSDSMVQYHVFSKRHLNAILVKMRFDFKHTFMFFHLLMQRYIIVNLGDCNMACGSLDMSLYIVIVLWYIFAYLWVFFCEF